MRIACLLTLLACCLFDVPTTWSMADDDAAAPKVLVLGLDGLRPEALRAAETPVIDALIADGAICWRAHTGPITVSGPGWSSVLTGVWMDKHGVVDNTFRPRFYDRYPLFFARLKQVRPDLMTASFVSWMPLDEFIVEASADATDIRFAHDYEDDGDERVIDAAIDAIRNDDPDVLFVYLADIDVAGHEHGFHPDVPPYLEEIAQNDAQIGRLVNAIEHRTTYADEDWLILMTTDHGGTIDGAHGRDEPAHREIVYLASGPSAGRGELRGTVNQVDIVATALAHLRIEPDPAWRLDGRPVGLKNSTPYGVNLIYNGDAELSTPALDVTIDRGVAGWTDLGPVTVMAYGEVAEYPGQSSPGPIDRGRCFFVGGGEVPSSRISQRIDVGERAADIDRGIVRFEASAYLGGFADQRDLAAITITFLADNEGLLSQVQLGPVTVEDRVAAIEDDLKTGLLRREATGHVPPGTRLIEVVLAMETATGACDGYADNISLVLRRRE